MRATCVGSAAAAKGFYRYLNVEVEDRRNEMELNLHGPMVGFGFVF
jgi:hypothetical protein